MTELTAQSIFDTVTAHLRSMPHRSINDCGCAYRSAGGLKCAVGCLITDEEYKPGMDKWDAVTELGSSVNDLIFRNLLPERLIPHRELLEDLQEAHDRLEYWHITGFIGESALEEIAAYHSLTYSAP